MNKYYPGAEPDTATLAWLESNLPEAVKPYRLWHANSCCVVAARELAAEWTAMGQPVRSGELMVRANVEAARASGLRYLGLLVAAEAHAELASTAQGVSESQVALLGSRLTRLEWLQADVRRETL